MNDTERIASIVKWVEQIETTKLSLSEFFERKAVPFSRVQYYNYRRQLRESGLAGLKDQRKRGGNRKITMEQESFLRGCIKQNPDVALEWLQQALMEEFSCDLSVSAIGRALARIDPKLKRKVGRPAKLVKAPRTDSNALGGFELIVALA